MVCPPSCKRAVGWCRLACTAHCYPWAAVLIPSPTDAGVSGHNEKRKRKREDLSKITAVDPSAARRTGEKCSLSSFGVALRPLPMYLPRGITISSAKL